MIVYRIGKTNYAGDLTGEGARLNGGRWNHKLTPCIYTSESRALAMLEYTANVNIDEIPNSLSITMIEISDSRINTIPISELPTDWNSIPAMSSTKDYGTNLLKGLSASIFKLPSAIIEDEFNYILNPLHNESRDFKIIDIKDFVYDIRVKLL
jgi:RES domain-containing protein